MGGIGVEKISVTYRSITNLFSGTFLWWPYCAYDRILKEKNISAKAEITSAYTVDFD